VDPDSSGSEPDLALKGFQKIFGSEALLNLVKSTFKLVVLGLVGYGVLRSSWPHFIQLGDAVPAEIAAVLTSATARLSLTVGVAFLVLGAIDYGVQFFRLEKSLKMSRQEVIQEYREQEGDPHVKARIRQIARQRARQRMLGSVAKADVVITNPTHIAIALKYDALVSPAPIVIAMGERKLGRTNQAPRPAGRRADDREPAARAGAVVDL